MLSLRNGPICVLGGTGFLGRRIVRRLRDHGHTVRIASRHAEPVRSAIADERLQPVRADIEDEVSLIAALAGTQGVVNAVSLYVERASTTFRSVHVEGAARVAREARRAGVERLIHVSGIGADPHSSSPYIRSRGEGELAVKSAFPAATIVRPAVMFGPDDAFLNTTLTLLRRLPAFPMFGNGKTRLQPADVEDVAEAIARAFSEVRPLYELGGPRIYPYEDLLRRIAERAGLRPVLVPVPFLLWQSLAWVAELLPRPPITRNQVELMRIDTVVASEPGFAALGISPRPLEDVLDQILSGGASPAAGRP
jgi:NADH dehydrogenase